MFRCPGQDPRFFKPEDIFEVACPGCGGSVEFFKDEPGLKCRSCGKTVANPKIDLGCAEWCKYAEKCVGVSFTKGLSFMRNRFIDEMKKIFAEDQKRIDHALKVLDYAETIQAVEGGDRLVVKAAAILHDIGIRKAEEKYGSSTAKYQEIEGPIIARAVLAKYELDKDAIEHICKIIANHHSAKDIDTLEFRILWDADWLVNLPGTFPDEPQDKLKQIIDRTFKTGKGRQIALELFIGN